MDEAFTCPKGGCADRGEEMRHGTDNKRGDEEVQPSGERDGRGVP